ncbi:MAG TPA: T9SS type A sorting domain-containing protein [Bacteroidia bacterium]|nr:T9SS type A sorting domain-containing protein [Bacteroidia bacterium]
MKKSVFFSGILLCASLAVQGQWTSQPSNITANHFVQFLDAADSNVVWGLVADPANQSAPVQEFTKTVDGGALWIGNPITNAAGLSPSGIFALNADTAWVAMFNGTASGGRILRTNDGGINWTWQTTATFTPPAGFPNMVHFFNANEGLCMGDPNGGYFEIYTTSDGGANWVRVTQPNIPANLTSEYGITSVYTTYGDSTLWFGTSLGRIYKTTDRGMTWSVASTPYAGSYIGDIAFRDDMNGIASNGSATATPDLIRTTDGGVTWTTVATNTAGIGNKNLTAVPGTPSTYFLSSPYVGGGSAFSTDDGNSWVPVDNLVHSDIEFVSPTTGYTGSNELNAPMFKWSGAIQSNCIAITGPLEFSTPDSICTVDSIIYSVHIDRTTDVTMRMGFNADFFDETYTLIGSQSVPDLNAAGFPNQFVPDAGQTDIGTYYFTVFFTLAPTSEIVHFGVQVFPAQCTDDTSNMIINSVFQNITTCAQTLPGTGTLTLDLSNCPQTGLVNYVTSYSYNGLPPIPGNVFTCPGSGTYSVTFNVDNGVCVKSVTDTITCFVGLTELSSGNFSLYPNPSSSYITISNNDGNHIAEVQLIDLAGRVISTRQQQLDGGSSFTISTQELSSGTYLLRTRDEKGYWITHRFVRN